jgi:hypothetical protein
MGKPTRKPGSDTGRPATDWEHAYQYWVTLPPEQRSYAQVAKEFGVSVRTVEAHARRDGWRARLTTIEAEAAKQADEQLRARRTAQLADFQQLIEASCVTYARQLANGQVRITASDFVGLIKITMQLQGGPSERVEVVSASEEWVALRSRILEAVSAYPDARIALAEALEADDEAL